MLVRLVGRRWPRAASTPWAVPPSLRVQTLCEPWRLASTQTAPTQQQQQQQQPRWLGLESVGRDVVLRGWVSAVRSYGPFSFVSLRATDGVTQLVIDAGTDVDSGVETRPTARPTARPTTTPPSLRMESVVEVHGRVRARPEDQRNADLRTGDVEVEVAALRVLNPGPAQLAIPVERRFRRASDPATDQEARLRHRFLDLRGCVLQRNLRARAAALLAARVHLSSADEAFVEVETPVLFKSTPEGAREFIVPTRHGTVPGTCFALTQSPQQYKQLLMAGGVERYFQVAKCFRDEGGRADRQPEFTQLDLEMAFASQSHVQRATERALLAMARAALAAAVQCAEAVSLGEAVSDKSDKSQKSQKSQESEKSEKSDSDGVQRAMAQFVAALEPRGGGPLPSVSLRECMERYGSDKPDRRFGLELSAGCEAVLLASGGAADAGADVSARARSLCAPGWAPSNKELASFVAGCCSAGRVWGAAVAVGADGEWRKCVAHEDMPAALKARVVGLSAEERAELLASAGAEANSVVVIAMADFGTALGGGERAATAALGLLGRKRLELHSALALPLDGSRTDLFWVTEFPLLELGADGALQATHHPFTMPVAEDLAALEAFGGALAGSGSGSDFTAEELAAVLRVRAQHYDLVCNGMELGGGSVRIHNAETQRHVLHRVLGMSEKRVDDCFGHLLAALASGCPPHAGIAIGVDRLMSILCGTASLSDVIAFPKSAAGREPLTGAPSPVPADVLREYNLAAIVVEE